MDNEGVSTTKKKPIAKKESLDLNRDGKLDREDKSLAAEALARDFKKVPAEPSKPVDGKKARRTSISPIAREILFPRSRSMSGSLWDSTSRTGSMTERKVN